MKVYAALTTVAAIAVAWTPPAVAKPKNVINLVDFGRVVELPDEPTRTTTDKDELTRGSDGWDTVRGTAGQYYIGVEWDEPRDITEVNIEFRHAIANREQIRVQYWEPLDGSGAQRAGGSAASNRGRWATPQTDWWAGDRDVSFAFGPRDLDSRDRDKATDAVRRTTRIRFLCGKEDLPPVRYLRAYGPGKVVTDTFDLRFADKARLPLPAVVKATNGFILSSDGEVTMESSVIHETTSTLQLRYYRDDTTSPNRTRITLSPLSDSDAQSKESDRPQRAVDFMPAQVATQGRLRLDAAGLVIERRGGPLASQPVR